MMTRERLAVLKAEAEKTADRYIPRDGAPTIRTVLPEEEEQRNLASALSNVRRNLPKAASKRWVTKEFNKIEAAVKAAYGII